MARARTGTIAGALVSLVLAAPCEAKTLIYCSEASPSGFNPATINSTTSTDTMRPVFNRLIEFERGTTNVVPGLAESWDISPDGTAYTFHLRHGVKFQTTKDFTPSRDFNADDVLYSFDRQWKAGYPDHDLDSGVYESFESMGMPELLRSIDKVEQLHCQIRADATRGAIPSQHSDLLGIDPVSRVRGEEPVVRHTREDRPNAGRHWAVHSD